MNPNADTSNKLAQAPLGYWNVNNRTNLVNTKHAFKDSFLDMCRGLFRSITWPRAGFGSFAFFQAARGGHNATHHALLYRELWLQPALHHSAASLQRRVHCHGHGMRGRENRFQNRADCYGNICLFGGVVQMQVWLITLCNLMSPPMSINSMACFWDPEPVRVWLTTTAPVPDQY